MNNTYINSGFSQTIVQGKNNHFQETFWQNDYDGKKANIYVKSNIDGKKEEFNFTLNNTDLENLLNIESINLPIHKRLKQDFDNLIQNNDRNKFYIELPKQQGQNKNLENKLLLTNKLLKDNKTHISSPSTDDEFIIPISIEKNTPYKRNKSHITYKFYKKPKSLKKHNKSKKSHHNKYRL